MENLSEILIAVAVLLVVGAVGVFYRLSFQKPKQPNFKKIATTLDNQKSKKKKGSPPPKESKKQETKKSSTPAASIKKNSSLELSSDTDSSPKKTPKSAEPKKASAETKKASPKPVDAKKAAGGKKSASNTPTTKGPKKAEQLNAKKAAAKKPEPIEDGWTAVLSRSDKKKKNEPVANEEMRELVKLASALSAKTANNAANRKKAEKRATKASPEKITKAEPLVNGNAEVSEAPTAVAPVVEAEKPTVVVEDVEKIKSNNKVAKEASIKVVNDVSKNNGANAPPAGGVEFNEVNDTWTEAKVPKKNKRKSRLD